MTEEGGLVWDLPNTHSDSFSTAEFLFLETTAMCGGPGRSCSSEVARSLKPSSLSPYRFLCEGWVLGDTKFLYEITKEFNMICLLLEPLRGSRGPGDTQGSSRL
ncbi:hypothetical protein ACRRTK_005776 [Alexandromys fortis]